jgi:hypothetical protein
VGTVSGKMKAMIVDLTNYLAGEDGSPGFFDQKEFKVVFAVLQHLMATEKEVP